jgi:hypothetical protein
MNTPATAWKPALAAMLACVALAACNTPGRQPRLLDPAITPAQAHPGDTVVLTAGVKDKFGVVDEVAVVLSKAPKRKLPPLRDDGVAPDAAAGDGIWTAGIDLPFMAPPGEFEIELHARDRHGNPLIVKTEDGEVPLVGHCRLVVVYPPDSGLLPPDLPGQPALPDQPPTPQFEVEIIPAEPTGE